jgi:hypothetical protein
MMKTGPKPRYPFAELSEASSIGSGTGTGLRPSDVWLWKCIAEAAMQRLHPPSVE